jgi:DNA-directed RNA polymerase subunit L
VTHRKHNYKLRNREGKDVREAAREAIRDVSEAVREALRNTSEAVFKR